MKLSSFVLLFLSSISSISAQTAAILAAAGYSAPAAPIPVAPGQVVTLFFRDVAPLPDGTLRTAQAKAAPLPTTLAGLSARIVQPPANLPIFSVRQENDCFGDQSAQACLLTSLRVQMPFNLRPAMELVLEVDGQSSRSFLLTEISDNAHVLTSCDLTWDTDWTHSCRRVAFHADGSPITSEAPARRSEPITVYFWGMGVTTPGVPAGAVSPSGVVLTQVPGVHALRARFLDRPLTSLTAIPAFFSAADAEDPGLPIDFVGLTPGEIGLYQVNLRVPDSLNPSTSCDQTILANIALRITTPFGGTQEIGLCLKP